MNNLDGNKTFTSTNKWQYVPGKVFALAPLNLQDIRKQLLDTSNEESDDSENETNNELETEDARISDILNKSFSADNPGSNEMPTEIQNGQKYATFEDHNFEKSTNKLFSSFSKPLETVPENILLNGSFSNDITMICENKENIPTNEEPLNLSTDHKQNISFDLDFSALSLHTPVKKEKSFKYITPKINIIPSTASKSKMNVTPLFKTPNVMAQSFTLNRPLFKTPVSKVNMPTLYSVKKQQGTPYSAVKSTTAINQHNMSIDNMVEGPKIRPIIYSSENGFKRISVNNTEYIVMNMLGRGGSSEVYYGFNLEENLHVAIKLVTLSDPVTAEGYINEVKLLESLQTCDRIIKMHDYEIRDEKLIVLLEKGGEDLNAILKKLGTRQSHLPIYMLLFYWMEMLYAVKQIHQNGVIHSDLKPANFLRAEGGLKLIDFGIACKVQEDMTCVYKSNQEGSCNYISPEALNLQNSGNTDSPGYGKPKYKVHYKSDVWSLGCILYQLVYRKTPFQHINQLWAKLAAITDPHHKISYPKAEWVSPRIVNTIRKCLQYDITARPSVDDLIVEYEQLLNII